MEKDKSEFWIGFIAWKDFTPHGVNLVILENALNKKLCLKAYGSGITSFNFIPMVLTPNNRVHEEEIAYTPKKKELDIQLKVDYQQAINAGVNGFLPLVGEVLLKGIDEAGQKNIHDFDWPRFRRDVEQLLSQNGWLLPVKV